MRFLAATAFLLIFVATVGAQQAGQKEQHRYVVVPPESVLLVVASQPDCPLKFKNAGLLTSAEGKGAWGANYQLRNVGVKPIKTYTAVMWTSYGTGGTLVPARRNGDLIMPGQTVSGNDGEIVDLTDELRDKLKLRGRMKAIVVLMIESIKFEDGSTYDDKNTSEALLAFFDSLETTIDRAARKRVKKDFLRLSGALRGLRAPTRRERVRKSSGVF